MPGTTVGLKLEPTRSKKLRISFLYNHERHKHDELGPREHDSNRLGIYRCPNDARFTDAEEAEMMQL